MIFNKLKKNISFHFLNATQFLGALNDNVFKLLIIFWLIYIQGISKTNIILSLAGAIFVIPFLLFSAAAGVLADRFSKRNIIVSMKIAEAAIMMVSLFAIIFNWQIGIFILLFFMASQSSIFGPSKYGIIPEIVPKEKISKANGILTSLTYLAIIIGTFLAAFITDITKKNFSLAICFCILISIAGLLTSIKIEKTAAKHSKKRINPFFIYEIYKTLKLSYKRKYLLPSIFGVGFFLFIGGFVQLNTIPFAIQALNLDEVGGGYLFLSTAIGIAIGALLAGKISKNNVELGISCISGFFTSIFLVMLGFCSSIFITVIVLIFLGISGGMFLIPFEAFLQIKSPEKKRGQIIASANFLSFFGVLLASLLLYLLNELLKLHAANSFIILGIIALTFNLINTGRISDLFIFYISKIFLNPFYKIDISNLPKKDLIIISEESSFAKNLFLFSKIENLKLIKIKKGFSFYRIFDSFLSISKNKLYSLNNKIKKLQEKNINICLLLKNISDDKKNEILKNLKNVFLIKKEKTDKKQKVIFYKMHL